MAAVTAAARAQPEGAARDLLLRTTGELMTELGTPDISLHMIARRAGVTAPLIKYYFGSKEGLLLALIERDTARSLAQMADLQALDLRPVDKLRHHITGIVRTYQRHPYLLGLLNTLLRGSDAASAERLKASVVTPLIEAQRAIIEDGTAAGELRAIDPDQLYFVIVGACQYLFASRVAFADVMGGKPADPAFARDFAATAVDVLLDGLRHRR